MADATSSIFNKKAAEKLRSPDDLDKYVRVTNPSIWVVLLACVALLAGLLAWGIFGTASTNVGATATYVDGKVMCFLTTEDVAKVHQGDSALIDGKYMTVDEVGVTPLSRAEVSGIVQSDYLESVIVTNDWTYPVTFTGDSANSFTPGIPLQTSITVDRIAPISLVLGGNF
jgi:hypothetical protein